MGTTHHAKPREPMNIWFGTTRMFASVPTWPPGFHRTKQKHENHCASPSSAGSTCLHNGDSRMQIPIPAERAAADRSGGQKRRGGGGEAIHSRNCALSPSLRHPSLETCSATADIVAYIVLTALSFRDRERERERECYKVLQGN